MISERPGPAAGRSPGAVGSSLCCVTPGVLLITATRGDGRTVSESYLVTERDDGGRIVSYSLSKPDVTAYCVVPAPTLRKTHTPMLLRHATPGRNLSAICRGGLRCSKSRGRLPVVWLHTAAKTAWAVPHSVQGSTARPRQLLSETSQRIAVQLPQGTLTTNSAFAICLLRLVAGQYLHFPK